FFSSRRRHTRFSRDWSSDVCSSDLGVSQATIQKGLGVARFDPNVVKKDRGQGVFSQTFLQFSDRMVEQYRVKQGPGYINKYADRSEERRVGKERRPRRT